MYRFKDGNTLVNISSSLLKRYGVAPYHQTYRPLDDLLDANRGKKVVLFLFDGMGKNILKKHRKAAPFIYKNRFKTISSVFPPTTVAATTALLSGLYPSENGRLGWWTRLNGHLAVTFTSEEFETNAILEERFETSLPYNNIFDLINRSRGHEIATQILGFTLGADDPRVLMKEVEAKLPDHELIYAYWTEPDHTMHEKGTDDQEVIEKIKAIDSALKDFVINNPEVLVLSLADHGMVDVVIEDIYEHPDFVEITDGYFSTEPRAAQFFVKPENRDKFQELYSKYYKDNFELYTKSEVISKQIFGPMDYESVKFREVLGDFLMVSTKNKYFEMTKPGEDKFPFKGQHAGGTKEEALIYLAVYNNL